MRGLGRFFAAMRCESCGRRAHDGPCKVPDGPAIEALRALNDGLEAKQPRQESWKPLVSITVERGVLEALTAEDLERIGIEVNRAIMRSIELEFVLGPRSGITPGGIASFGQIPQAHLDRQALADEWAEYLRDANEP